VNSQPPVRFSNLFQADGTFRDEISLALGGARLFKHRKESGAAVEKLRSHQPGDSTDLIQAFAELDDATRESERAIADILTRPESIG